MSSPAAVRTSAEVVPVPRRRRPFFESAPLRISVFVVCLLWFLPTMGLLVTSLRDPQDITQTGWWTALLNPFDLSQWTLQNYANVLTADGMAQAFVNSLIVAVPATVIPITVAAFAAYAFAWMRFPFRITLFIIVVGLLVVPLQMALIPVLQVYSATGIAGTFLGVWLAHTGFGLPLAVFLLYNFISQLPEDLFETSAIDGATHFQVFTRIVLPLSVPALAAFAIFQFMWVWNDLLVALVFLGPQDNVAVATVKLTQLVGNRGEQWHVLTAAAFITMILPLAVFLALQRYFIRGILAGSVKG
jgi:alpha-glucoside transport system permease protein